MSSVTMAADSTQADIIHHRARPVVKAASSVQTGFRRGHQQVHRRDRSHSRHHSSSSRSHKQKRRSREHQVKKGRRRYNSSQSRSHDDTSDRDSDLDLSKDLLPISGYVRIKDEMVDHMFRSISNRKLRAMLPEILRPLSSDELKKLCVEQLEVMSKKRVCRILDGADPETISSSGTDEEDEDEEGSSGSSTDAEDGGPEVGSAYADNEAVGSTSQHAADDLPLKNSHLENEYDDDYLGDRNDNSAINSSENKEVPAAVDDAGKDCHVEERDGVLRDGKMEEEGEKASKVMDKTSVIDRRGLDGDEIFGITIKVNEARFRMEDPETSVDVGGRCSQEESMKMNKRNIERSYRAKQLDDDERENDSEGGGVREENLMEEVGLGVGTSRSRPKKDEELLSDSESIPSSLPHLDSEPEETCCPFVLLDTKFSQELTKSVEVDQKDVLLVSSEKLPETAVMTGSKESKEASIDCESFITQFGFARGKILSLDESVCPNGASMTHANNETREQKESVEERRQDVSELKSENNSQKKSHPPQLRTLSSVVESVTDGEEMVIEIQEHEFSDDVGDDGDVGYEREKENEGKKESVEDSTKGDKVSTKVPQPKEAAVSDEQRKGDDAKLIDDERLEKLEMESIRELPPEEDSTPAGKTLILGRSKAPESGQRGLKRKSVEIADERLQSKMQKQGGKATSREGRSEERSDSNSEQKKCIRTKNSGLADVKTALTSRADLNPEAKLSGLSSFETCHRSESEGPARTSVLQPNTKRETSLPPGSAEQDLSKSPAKLSRASSIEEISNRKVIFGTNKGLPDATLSARVKGERPELQISSSRVESSQSVEATGRPTTSKTPHRTPSHQKLSTAEHSSPSEAGKEPSTPVLSKTQLEILELEMRARAIKAMLKAQEELEKREEKLKMEEKRHSVISSASQLPRSSQAVESRNVVHSEARMVRIGTSYRGDAVAGPKTVGGADLTQRVVHGDVAALRQSQDKRLVERRPALALAEETSSARTVQSNRLSAARPGFKSLRDVVGSNRFPNSAYRLMKRPLASATRGRGGGASSSCTGTRIVRLSSGPRADSRSVVPALKPTAMRQTSGGPDKTSKMAIGDREDVRRVVAALPASARCSHALKVANSSLRYGHRDREHGSSPNRDQKRSVVAWNRRVNYKQQVSKTGRF